MKKILKIVFLVDDFPPYKNTSSGKVVFELARQMNEFGHDVSVITSVQEKSMEKEEVINGLRVFRIYAKYHLRWRYWLSIYNPQTVFKVKKILRNISPDVVNFRHIHQYLSFACFRIAKKYAKAVFLTANDVLLFSLEKVLPKNGTCLYKINVTNQIKQAQKRYNPFRGPMIRHYLKYVDRIFTISNSLREALKINGIRNTTTIYNGIDVNQWTKNNAETENFKTKHNLIGKKVLMFGGRPSGAKGIEQLLYALSEAKRVIKNITLLMASEKIGYIDEIKKIVDKLQLRDNIVFTEYLKGRDLIAAYNSADIYIYPSIHLEAFGMAGLEAMACSRPIIGSCFGGIHEMIISGKTGYVINPLDIKVFSEKIIDLLENPDKAKGFGRAGLELAKSKFSLEEKTKETLEQYYGFLK